MRRGWKRSVMLIALMTMLLLQHGAIGESYTANTMRLLRYEGDAAILDAQGNERFIMENVRFASGETLRTGAASSASVSLDASKIVSLDAETSVTFAQSANQLTMSLTKGTLFLDVSEKLDENEKLDIQTTTMTIGIRGTIVFVTEKEEAQPNGEPTRHTTTLGVLEGTAQVTTSRQEQALSVPAGTLLTVEGLGGEETAALRPMAAEDLKQSAFLLRMLRDETIYERVEESCPELTEAAGLFAADGDWTWNETVTLIAQSASSLFDGEPLRHTDDVLVCGLPDMFTVIAHASGTQTNTGKSANPVADYTILNASGEDVTAHFRDIQTVPGWLVVDRTPMTVWTGSAEKPYDGTPLLEPNAGIKLFPGHRTDERWRNAAIAVSDVGAEALYGVCGSVVAHGIHPLTGESREIELHAGERLTVYLEGSEENAGIRYQVERLEAEELPEELLRLYADNPFLLRQVCAETGWDSQTLLDQISKLPKTREETLEREGLRVARDQTDRLICELANVRIQMDTEVTDYSHRALTDAELRFAEIRVDDTLHVTATGSQTAVGSSENTYVIDWGGADPDSYTLMEELGTLTVYAQCDMGHTPVTDAAVEPTCTEAGLTEGTHCSVCGEVLTEQQEIPALGHAWGEPDYTWMTDYHLLTAHDPRYQRRAAPACTAERACLRNCGQVETETSSAVAEVTAASCETDGRVVYTASFANPSFTTQSMELTLAALGHDWGEPSYEWSVVEYGEYDICRSVEYDTCTATHVCRRDASHVETETANADITIVEPTCEAAGKAIFTAVFSNPSFAAQSAELTLEPLGHFWLAPSYQWFADTVCEATRVCLYDSSHVETETVAATPAVTEPTCETPGKVVYTASFVHPAFTPQSFEITLAATGHDWDTPNYEWSAEYEHCTATHICRHNASHTETETVAPAVVYKEPECETPGSLTFTATFSNPAFEQQIVELTIEALGHDYQIDESKELDEIYFSYWTDFDGKPYWVEGHYETCVNCGDIITVIDDMFFISLS